MASLPWFRMYSEFATDPKVQSMDETLQRRFIMFLCLQCSGEFEQLTDDELAFALRIETEEVTRTKEIFTKKGFLKSGKISNWNKRQFKSDNSTKRVKEFRKRKRNVSVTPCNVSVTPSDTDTDTDTDSPVDTSSQLERSERLLPQSPSDGEGKPAKKRKPPAKACPDPFLLTAEMVAWAKENTPGVDPKAETAIFVDHWRSNRKTKDDWLATWRNWMRREQKQLNARHVPAGAGPPRPAAMPKQVSVEWQQLHKEASRLGFRDERYGETPDQFREALKKYQEVLEKGAVQKLGIADALKEPPTNPKEDATWKTPTIPV